MPAPTRRWGAAIPAVFLLACIGARLATLRPAPPDPMPLYERASRAYGESRFAEAAEYARHALGQGAIVPLRAELLCLRGESLLRAGQAGLAAQAFEEVLAQPEPNPYVAQALFGLMQGRAADGDTEQAHAARDRLLRDFAASPWADRARNAL
jgi:tetratricopeptide (TPR) repeat protein